MSQYVITSQRITIGAPASFVWSVLTDFDKYSEWNPFTPYAQTTLQIGSPVRLKVRMWPGHRQIIESVRAVEPPHLLSWNKAFPHRSILFAVRNQIIESDSQLSCVYYNTDSLSGFISQVIGPMFRRYMNVGFNDVGVALKERSESLYYDMKEKES